VYTTVCCYSYYIKFVSSTTILFPLNTHRLRFPVLVWYYSWLLSLLLLLLLAPCVCRRPVGVWTVSLLRWCPAVVSPPTIIFYGFPVKWLRLTWIPFYHGRNTIERSWTARVRITSILFSKCLSPFPYMVHRVIASFLWTQNQLVPNHVYRCFFSYHFDFSMDSKLSFQKNNHRI